MKSLYEDLLRRNDVERLSAWINLGRGKCFYIEKEYDERINTFIQKHHHQICQICDEAGVRFCYIPQLAEELLHDRERIRYAAPWLKDDAVLPPFQTSDFASMLYPDEWLCNLRPSLLMGSEEVRLSNEFEPERMAFPEGLADSALLSWLSESLSQRTNHLHRHIPRLNAEFGYLLDAEEILSEDIPEEPVPDSEEWDSHLKQIEQEIRWMELHGMDRRIMVRELSKMIRSKDETLSSLHITRDLDIVLPEYGKTISLRPIDKATYLVFLAEEGGINYKDITDYKEDLMNYYRRLTNRVDEDVMWRTIENQMASDSLSQSIRKIRLTFQHEFDDQYARHYYVDGRQGEAKKVSLPRHLIVWEEYE